MKNLQEHNLLRKSGKHSQLTLRHQLTRLVWNITWKVVTCLLPNHYGGVSSDACYECLEQK